MDVDGESHRSHIPEDLTILVLQEQQSIVEKQELIFEQTQALVNGQKELQREMQQLQSTSPAGCKRKRSHAHQTGSGSPNNDADDEDEDDDGSDEARPRKKKGKLPSIFHVIHTFVSY